MEFYNSHSKKIVLILILLFILLISNNIQIRSNYNRTAFDTYYLTVDSMKKIDFNNINDREDIRELKNIMLNIYNHIAILSKQLKDSSLILQKDRDKFNSAVIKLTRNLEDFILYHNSIFARGEEIPSNKFSNYNTLKSEFLILANEFDSKGWTQSSKFGIRQYNLDYDSNQIGRIEKRVENISEIIHNLIGKK